MKKLSIFGFLTLGVLATYACAQNAATSNEAAETKETAETTVTNTSSETTVTRTENGANAEIASGKVNSQTREVGNFSELHIALNVETRLVQGSEDKVVVEIDDNLQKNIVCTNKNGKLTIEEKGSYKWTKTEEKALVTVYFKDINKLKSECNGKLSGSIKHASVLNLDLDNNGETVLTIETPSLIANTACNGSVTLKGEAAKATLENSNNGSFDAKDLKTAALSIENSSNGSTSVFASASIIINHSANGSLSYYGNPAKKIIKNTGNGSVKSK
jgi:Putative auto-transporter adhesin, head GIN domain